MGIALRCALVALAASAAPGASAAVGDALAREAEETATLVREAIVRGVAAGRRERVTIGVGASVMRGTLEAAAEGGITVKTNAAVIVLPWERLSPERLYLVGRAFVAGEDARLHLRLARFCIAHGLAAHARGELVAAATAPELAADVASSEALLRDMEDRAPAGSKKPPPTPGLGPLPPGLPSWLGTRPPVAGDWVKTLDDEFDGTELDFTIWNDYGPNYWDKVSHWSRANTVVGGGLVRLRYEKKTGRHNDEPNGLRRHRTPPAS